MQVSKDKLSLQYTGPGDHETDVGCIQANHAVPKNTRIYYYEVHIVNAGMKGLISIGFAEKGFNLGKHPGYCLILSSCTIGIYSLQSAICSAQHPSDFMCAKENTLPKVFDTYFLAISSIFSQDTVTFLLALTLTNKIFDFSSL